MLRSSRTGKIDDNMIILYIILHILFVARNIIRSKCTAAQIKSTTFAIEFSIFFRHFIST